MNKPTKAEIENEITALKALKPTGAFARKTAAAIKTQIEVLTGELDMTAEEFEELDDEQQDNARDADEWKRGIKAKRPSTEWGELVEGKAS